MSVPISSPLSEWIIDGVHQPARIVDDLRGIRPVGNEATGPKLPAWADPDMERDRAAVELELALIRMPLDEVA